MPETQIDETVQPQRPRGRELLRAAVNQILEHPEAWNQGKWHCGTAHCIGGWCQFLGTGNQNSSVVDVLPELIDVSYEESKWLCESRRSLYEIYQFAKCHIAREEYFRGGYDRYGYNRDGYDRGGYDRYGAKLPLL